MSKPMEPTEVYESPINVIFFSKQSKEKKTVGSISDAITEVKETTFSTAKIELDGEVVYFSERHGEIGRWEDEWKRQKRKISVNKSVRDCPFDVDACYEHDLCIDCKMKKATENA